MDCMEDQQPKFKYYCRVCKKGFLCGRALGGHMRAHGIGDEGGNLDDDDPVSDWEDKFGGGDRTCNRRMYQLRTNPNRLKSCRVCENCGKEFSSWKSFLEHGKCSSEDAESLVSSPGSDGEYEGSRRGCQQWSKRKRSLRTKVGSFCTTYPSSEDEDLLLAKCLVDLANAGAEVEPEESCASASKEEEKRINPVAAYFNAPLASRAHLDKTKGASKGLFECKACKKVFNSHQALGGHRASHKKVKGCYAAKQDQLDDSLADDDVIIRDEFFPSKSFSSLQFEQGPTIAGASRRRSKVHECTICHRVFSSGQALGGHKRCHWITSNSQETSSLVKLQFHDHMDPQTVHQGPAIIKSETLDLNIPASQGPDHNVTGILRRDPQNPLSFEVSTDIRLHTWTTNLDAETKRGSLNCHHQNINDDCDNESGNSDDIKINQNNNIISSNVGPTENVDDEADSKVELGKLSDLKDINISGSSSQWLQVGIGSTPDVTAKP